MPSSEKRSNELLRSLVEDASKEELVARLEGNRPRRVLPRIPGATRADPPAVRKRLRLTNLTATDAAELFDPATESRAEAFAANVENLIGTVKIPVGLSGPLWVRGLHASGDYYLPLATSEAALVASYSRGCQAITDAGGCRAALLAEGVCRAPGFEFRTLAEAGQFVAWVLEHAADLREVAGKTTRHGALVEIRVTIEGNHVYLPLDFTTGDAAGQNMVTIATEALCDWIIQYTPVKPLAHYVEANLSGDKKASAQSFLGVRGKKVTAEVELPREVIERRLRSTGEAMERYWRMSAVGGVLSGTLGVQGHYANGLAAIYLACGQDVACVAESAVGVTRFEQRDGGGLYATVTLPNLIVGTVGGGTGLPTARACLEIMGLRGSGKARAFAEVIAALCLAGELSIIAALSAGHFTRAHAKLARRSVPQHTETSLS